MTQRLSSSVLGGGRRLYQIGDVLQPGEFPVVESIYRVTGKPAPTRWFVVQTNPNCEAKAEAGLAEAQADAYLPRLVRWKAIPERQRKPRGPKREAMTRPLFPGYLFLGWSHEGEPPWLNLRRVDGVRAVLRPTNIVSFTMLILGLRAEELAGDFDGCSRKPKRFAIGKFAPQFIAMSESERVRELMRCMRGVEVGNAA